MHYQHRSNDTTQNDDECAENKELIPSPRPVAKEPELSEKYSSICEYSHSIHANVYFSVATRKIDTLLTKVAANKHVQRFASFKPVAGVIEKISKAEIGANVAITDLSGVMTVNFFLW